MVLTSNTVKKDKTEKTAGNNGLAKGGLTCLIEMFVLKQTFGLHMNLSAKNPALRQLENG